MSEITRESTSKFVQAGDVKIHYHEAGTGPVLLCIHGGAPGAFGWGNFGYNMEELSKHFRVLIVDLPGFGKSDKPVISGGRFEFGADVFAKMLVALDIPRAHIVGMATGGAVACYLADQVPRSCRPARPGDSAGGMPLFQLAPSEGQKVISGSYYLGDGPSITKMRRYLEMVIHDKALITDAVIQETL